MLIRILQALAGKRAVTMRLAVYALLLCNLVAGILMIAAAKPKPPEDAAHTEPQ